MHVRIITRFIAILILFLGLSMTGPLLVAFLFKDRSIHALLFSLIITSVTGLILLLCTRKPERRQLNHRDGVAIVTLGWIMASLFGTLPYILSGAIPDFTNAYFESISGFTTTGASILSDVEALPEGILF